MGFQNVFGHRQKIGFGALSGPPAPVYGPYTIAFSAVVVSRGGVVTNAEKARLTTFETSLGSDILEFDRLWIHALSNNIAARTSFVNPLSTIISAVNGPTFTPNLGYTGDGTTSYLNSNFNPATQGVKYTLNSASGFTYIQQNIVSAGAAFGAIVSSDISVLLYPQFLVNTPIYYINNLGTDSYGAGTSQGLSSFIRINSTNIAYYKNGAIAGTNVKSSSLIPNTSIYICGRSTSGILTNGFNGTISATGLGSNSYNQLNFYNALQALATSLGWNV
jgi:hypothetical protein